MRLRDLTEDGQSSKPGIENEDGGRMGHAVGRKLWRINSQ
jgi:hypothetical protein